MKICIINIEKDKENICITGRTSIGSIKGRWICETKPVIGEDYFIELALPEVGRKSVTVSEQNQNSVCIQDDMIVFTGICENIDDVYDIRFDIDWLEIVEIGNDDFEINIGDRVLFSVKYDSIEVYPYSI